MSEYVEFTPKGLVVHKWSGDKQRYLRKKPRKYLMGTYLRSRCEIAEGTTLRNIFDTVDRYKFLKMIVSQYAWCRQIDEFHAQAREPMRDDDDDAPLNRLEIYWHPEVHEFTEKVTHPGGHRERIRTVDFDASTGFHGIGLVPESKKDDPNYHADEKGEMSWSVSYSPMWKLADLPVVLKKEFVVYEPWRRGEHKKGPPQKLVDAKREFTLLEVLDAIYWDISFYGGPADNAEFIEEMNERMDEIKRGDVPMIPMEQVFKDLKEGEEEPAEGDDKKMKVLFHPDVARFFGVNPDAIPLDDKEIIRPDDEQQS